MYKNIDKVQLQTDIHIWYVQKKSITQYHNEFIFVILFHLISECYYVSQTTEKINTF
jgi:hypothetical protein